MLTEYEKLNTWLRTATEAEIQKAIKTEQHGLNRMSYLRRMHMRLTRLRATRERAALLNP